MSLDIGGDLPRKDYDLRAQEYTLSEDLSHMMAQKWMRLRLRRIMAEEMEKKELD
jgi:hypothetical protein